MTTQRQAIGAKIEAARKLAQDTREGAAAKLLDLETVLLRISEAAAQGSRSVVIRPDQPLAFQKTKAAEKLDLALRPLDVTLRWQVISYHPESEMLEILF